MELPELIHSVLSDKFKQQTVIIFGLGTEGFSTYQTIRSTLPDQAIWVCDDKNVAELLPQWQTALTGDQLLHFFQTNSPTPDHFAQQWPTEHLLISKTPGISFTHPFLATLHRLQKTITYTSNIELFLEILHALPADQRPQTIGITGTKGKSTTTALIFHVLQQAGKLAFLAGNIGVPALELLTDLQELPVTQLPQALVVLELSSHQLQGLPYSPHIAVVQNITPEHLDYYQNFEEYVAAKAAITTHQTAQDFVIFNPEYEIPRQFAQQSHAQPLPFSLHHKPAHHPIAHEKPLTATTIETLESDLGTPVAYVQDHALYYQDEQICALQEVPLQGEHNLLNTFPSIIVGKLLGIPASSIAAAIKSFKSLPHRLEFVAERNGVAYYNDSQGTTPEASMAALRSFSGKPIVLLAGGSDKGVAFMELAEEIIKQQVTDLLLFPPTGEKIEWAVKTAAHDLGKTAPQFHHVSAMQDAVIQAAQLAQPGGVVLLSPACASFGLFKNYQDRGNQFKTAVLALVQNHSENLLQ